MGIPCQKSMLPGVNKWRPVTNAQNNRSLAQLNNYPPCNKSPANNNSLCPMLLKSPEQMFLKINHPFQQLGNKLRKVRYDKPASMFIAGSL